LLIGLGLGFFLAAQVGPVTLLIVRSVLRGGRAVAVGVAMAGAVASIDLLYAALGLAGAGRLLGASPARLALGLLSAAILVGIGARTLWRGLRARSGAEGEDEVATPAQAFGTAVAATALNPLTIALWTVSFPASAPHAAVSSTAHAVLLLGGVAIGTLGWYGGFALSVAAVRRRIGPRFLQAIDVLLGSGLIVFGSVLGHRTLSHDSPSR
jgi:threonine/homoserine/homoserine lactone efflux protein